MSASLPKRKKSRFAFARRPSLLALTAGFAGIAALANAMAAGTEPVQTRMGASIQDSLDARDQSAAKQKRALELREQVSRAAEARLKANAEARRPAAAPAAVAVAGPSSAQPGEIGQPFEDLARIYQTMKPARAAPIFERLDLDVQLRIARAMRERSTALILSNMSPNAAVRLSMALAGYRVRTAPVAVAAAAPAGARRPGALPQE